MPFGSGFVVAFVVLPGVTTPNVKNRTSRSGRPCENLLPMNLAAQYVCEMRVSGHFAPGLDRCDVYAIDCGRSAQLLSRIIRTSPVPLWVTYRTACLIISATEGMYVGKGM
jgi:hypothetical protein